MAQSITFNTGANYWELIENSSSISSYISAPKGHYTLVWTGDIFEIRHQSNKELVAKFLFTEVISPVTANSLSLYTSLKTTYLF